MKNAFCWAELVTSDMAAAKGFYGGLYGWGFEDMQTPSGPYAVIQIKNGMGGGVMPLPEGLTESWMPYIAVERLEDTIALAEAAGGAIVLAPADLADSGRIAWITDPEGARLGLFQSGPDSPLIPVPDPEGGTHVCFVEELVSNAGRMRAFYEQLFGWEFETGTACGDDYVVIHPGVEPKGGLLVKPEPSMASAWMPYLQVADVSDALAKALSAGASLVADCTAMGAGTFAVYQDPGGAHMGIYQPN